MKMKTQLKAGGQKPQHNETLKRDAARGLKVKTHLKAGALQLAKASLTQNLFMPLTSWERFAGGVINHNETLVRDGAK